MTIDRTSTERAPPDEAPGAADRGGVSWPFAIAMIALGIAAILAMFWDPVRAALQVWTSHTYQFAFLIIPVSLYLVWDRRRALAFTHPEPAMVGVFATLFFGLLWLFGEFAQISVGEQIAVVGMMQSLFLTALGWRIYRTLLFPFLYLWLLVPMGAALIPWMQQITAVATVAGLRILGIFVRSEAIIIEVPSGRYAIVEECASLDFLLGLLAFALVFANLMYRGWLKRTIFVGLMPFVWMLANGLRTTSIIAINHFTESRIDLVAVHVKYGWALYAVVILLIFWIGKYFRDRRPPDVDRAARRRAPATGAARPAYVALAVVAVVAAAGLGPAYAALFDRAAPAPGDVVFCRPEIFETWRLPAADDDWRPPVAGASAQLHRRAMFDGAAVDLFIGYYWRQSEGREVVSARNRPAPRDRWLRLEAARERVEVDGVNERVAASRFGSGKHRRLVWHWYWVNGRYTDSPFLAKLLTARARLLGDEQRAAFVAISAEEGDGRQTATRALRRALGTGVSLRALLESAALGACEPSA